MELQVNFYSASFAQLHRYFFVGLGGARKRIQKEKKEKRKTWGPHVDGFGGTFQSSAKCLRCRGWWTSDVIGRHGMNFFRDDFANINRIFCEKKFTSIYEFFYILSIGKRIDQTIFKLFFLKILLCSYKLTLKFISQ